MLIRQVDCVVKYIAGLNDSLKKLTSTALSKSQCNWMATVLMGIIVAGSQRSLQVAQRIAGSIHQNDQLAASLIQPPIER